MLFENARGIGVFNLIIIYGKHKGICMNHVFKLRIV